ncbi:Glycosyltransferase family 9 (heptosyltransferase) [Sphingomonas palmae]|uniref:Glycosyltransferase family 9 (Heptosyltransferase) n=1 Tax=Sphingomonas palmae TaxID=1855283 RepID=A0A1H7R823_9SPHN|nr:glycosyltransferase family 9 protein [Sphingomonas palmae]SEL56371.1 Glycosyltransferase family 9 (heptosyltransferase) [Sphingomonas palmae]
MVEAAARSDIDPWTAAMRRGDYAAAFAIGDDVIAGRDPAERDDPRVDYHRRWVWNGRAFDGEDVLVRCYHGLGDSIQFARYLPLLARRARSVTVEAPARLHGLLGGIAGVDRMLAFDHARPAKPSACDIEITELPQALRATPDDARAPYLRASPAALPAGTIGLCYSAGDWDHDRRVPPALLAPLCAGRRCLSLVAEPTDLGVLNPDGCPFDIDATASLIAACSLVITVDTMIAHLAGALGRPTWLMLKAEPDWRWSPDRTDTPWYPTMRLFVQPRAGDWAGVVAKIADALDTRTHQIDEGAAYGVQG